MPIRRVTKFKNNVPIYENINVPDNPKNLSRAFGIFRKLKVPKKINGITVDYVIEKKLVINDDNENTQEILRIFLLTDSLCTFSSMVSLEAANKISICLIKRQKVYVDSSSGNMAIGKEIFVGAFYSFFNPEMSRKPPLNVPKNVGAVIMKPKIKEKPTKGSKACIRCGNNRILNVSAIGYVPKGIGIVENGSNSVNISLCLDCGQIQGKFPKRLTKSQNT